MKTRLACAALAALILSRALAAQSSQELYQQGLVQEQAHGNLREAIGLYSKAAGAAGKDRELAARALIRVAGAHEKLGETAAAIRAYGDIVRGYPEQRAEVAVAQDRLAALRRTSQAGGVAPAGTGTTDVSSLADPMFSRYCTRCHGPAEKTAGLDLASLNTRNVADNTAVWEKVSRRLLARRDPPTGSPRPDDRTYRAMIARLDAALDAAHTRSSMPNGTDRITETELATRVAALLWSGAPDAPLLDDARRGGLRGPGVLQRHVVRMLRDPRAAGLVSGFFASWLSLDNLKMVRPDPAVFPQFESDMLQVMETETRLFLESQLREDRDAVEMWSANYTYVNDRLARYYGLPAVTGRDFRRVTLPDGNRGGILGQAGPLTLMSFATRTSPTVRGRYVLGHFFGVEAPPPPANVPALSDSPASRSGSMRERIMAHKINPSCASCHAIFDPLGLALENFDGVGRWRTTDGGAAIDASGTFIDGTPFNGPAGLKSGLLKYRDAYYTTVAEQLLAYALNRNGKKSRVYDYEMPAVRQIVREASANGHRWSAFLTGIVKSAPFQMQNIVP